MPSHLWLPQAGIASYNDQIQYITLSTTLTDLGLNRSSGTKKHMPNFQCTGPRWNDFWTVDGSKDFAILPARTLPGFDLDIPIRLQVGNPSMGAEHMTEKHWHWMGDFRNSVSEFVHFKLQQKGSFYHSGRFGRYDLILHTHPSALAAISFTSTNRTGNFFTLITMHNHRRAPRGDLVGLWIP